MTEPASFSVLGPLEVRVDGEDRTPTGRKQRVLLTLLVLHLNEAVGAERLVDRVWDGRPPPTAANALQVYVSQLRKLLAGHSPIETTAHGYRLSAPRSAVDLFAFEDGWTRGRELLAGGDPNAAANELRAALALWRGEALADMLYDSFGSAEARRLDEMRIDATIDLIEAELRLGRHADVVPRLQRLVQAHPLREHLACLLPRCSRHRRRTTRRSGSSRPATRATTGARELRRPLQAARSERSSEASGKRPGASEALRPLRRAGR